MTEQLCTADRVVRGLGKGKVSFHAALCSIDWLC